MDNKIQLLEAHTFSVVSIASTIRVTTPVGHAIPGTHLFANAVAGIVSTESGLDIQQVIMEELISDKKGIEALIDGLVKNGFATVSGDYFVQIVIVEGRYD